ncbi:hypothetical protein H2203_004521 [Taxawa tesnikishii (nom. ined.)]|nr:hypothetical protein H2203_004521 [Dothideales sp. JES 119]
MASLIKNKISEKVSGGSSSSGGSPQTDSEIANKYKLRVTAGSSYDRSTEKVISVNSSQPCFIENEFLRAKIKVRVRDYHGLPQGSKQHSSYFDDPMHSKDFSDLVWGNDFDHPVRDKLPPGFNTAFKIAKEFVDPGLSCDAYADKPWLYGPALSCWFAFVVGDKYDNKDFPAPDDENPMKEGGDGSGESIRQDLNMPPTGDKRRKFFLDAANRQKFTFEKGRCYQGDFFNPYVDFSNYSLKLPGFSLNVLRYVGDQSHRLRYTFKNVKTDEVMFVVVFTLLYGEQLEKALSEGTEEAEQDREPEGADPSEAMQDESRGKSRSEKESSEQQAREGASPAEREADGTDKGRTEGEKEIPESSRDKVQKHLTEHRDNGKDISQRLDNTATAHRSEQEPDIMK